MISRNAKIILYKNNYRYMKKRSKNTSRKKWMKYDNLLEK